MDMDFRKAKKPSDTDAPEIKDAPKELPGFRSSSELPAHGSDEAGDTLPVDTTVNPLDHELADAFEEDPTDLTLDRDKNPNADTDNKEPQRAVPKVKKKLSKKTWLLISVATVIVLCGAGAAYYFLIFKKKPAASTTSTSSQTTVAKKDAKPTTVPSPITGIDVTPDAAKKPVTAVMIENSADARPQSGLKSADLVMEAIAEGGITRFVALFQQNNPESIGPIRSARPYYVEMARTFDAAYVHAGGSGDGLQRITDLGVKDMSAFEDNGTYVRINSRPAPHNLYSSMTNLDIRRAQLGYATSNFTSWKHKKDTAQDPSASSIHFDISSPIFNPDFTYDVATNSYRRSIDGEPQTDASPPSGADPQIMPKVVIGLITNVGNDGYYSTYRLTGNGDMIVFQDGIESKGTWSKDSATSQFVFKDKNGLEFAFNKGQVWITLIGSEGDVSVQP